MLLVYLEKLRRSCYKYHALSWKNTHIFSFYTNNSSLNPFIHNCRHCSTHASSPAFNMATTRSGIYSKSYQSDYSDYFVKPPSNRRMAVRMSARSTEPVDWHHVVEILYGTSYASYITPNRSVNVRLSPAAVGTIAETVSAPLLPRRLWLSLQSNVPPRT